MVARRRELDEEDADEMPNEMSEEEDEAFDLADVEDAFDELDDIVAENARADQNDDHNDVDYPPADNNLVADDDPRAPPQSSTSSSTSSSSSSSTTSNNTSSSSATATPTGPQEQNDGQPPVAQVAEAVPEPRQAQRPPAPRPEDNNYTVEEARHLLPPLSTLSMWNNRAWLVKYTDRTTAGPKSHTATWGEHTQLSVNRALRRCLQWVWERHHERTGSMCPFSLEDWPE